VSLLVKERKYIKCSRNVRSAAGPSQVPSLSRVFAGQELRLGRKGRRGGDKGTVREAGVGGRVGPKSKLGASRRERGL